MADVEDALVWSIDLSEAFQELISAGLIPKDGIDMSVPPKPDPEHPGRGFLDRPATMRVMKDGHVLVGDWNCSRCGKLFYMEIAIRADGYPCDSLGGVWHSKDVVICDDCSPF